MKGRYRIITTNRQGEQTVSPWIKNLVMEGASNGVGVIMRQLAGDTVYPIAISSAAIGTGATAPTISDTNLQTPVLTGIPIRTKVAATNTVTFKFFIPDGDLTNGTYTEFGLFAGTRLFARSIISPSYVKTTGLDAIIEYELTIT
jgi:hypothetical protein